MPQAYVGDQIGIRSTSDTVEQVQEALGTKTGIRVDASATDDEPKPEEEIPGADEKPDEGDEPDPDETEEDKEEREQAEADAAAEAELAKSKKGKPMPVVPRARLNEEIRKNKELERQLAAKSEKVEPETPAAEVRPVTYCGRPEPKIEDYTGNAAKYPDPYAAFIKDNGQWVRDETRAELAYESRQAAAQKAREAEYAPFNASVAETLKRRPDYNDVVNGSKVPISDRMADFVTKEAEIGAEVLLYLSENPDEAERIRELSIREQRVEMFALEATLMEELGIADDDDEPAPPKKTTPAAVPKKAVSKTPAPPARIKAGGPGIKSLQDLAGPVDREGIRVEYNPAYTAAVKARRGT